LVALAEDAEEVNKLLPQFLVPELVTRQDGEGLSLDVGNAAGSQLLLTLGITRIIEQESLDVAIQGSVDGQKWDEKPLIRFPQKFYCGTYTLLVDLARRPDVKYIRAVYKVNRWGRGDAAPLFGFYLFVQKAADKLALASAVA
jgi:hypothetical protein